MHNGRRQSASAQRFEERRQREDSAPRLAAEVPDLLTLKLSIGDRSDSNVAQPKHVRYVVVARAPALFLIGCSDPSCKDGGHDVTDAVMRALFRRETTFDGEDKCHGALGPSPCSRVLYYSATASYREPGAPGPA